MLSYKQVILSFNNLRHPVLKLKISSIRVLTTSIMTFYFFWAFTKRSLLAMLPLTWDLPSLIGAEETVFTRNKVPVCQTANSLGF